jgi:Urease beta subunit
MRLDISAGPPARFEPGDEREVDLVPFGGERRVHGLDHLTEVTPPSGSRRHSSGPLPEAFGECKRMPPKVSRGAVGPLVPKKRSIVPPPGLCPNWLG